MQNDQIVDADWIRARLTGRHGEKAGLARHMGILPNTLTKILTGVRKVQGAEVLRVLEYFQGGAGLSEADLARARRIAHLSEAARRQMEDYLAFLEDRERHQVQ